MTSHLPYCLQIQQELLELDWDAQERQKAARVLKHLDECEKCRAAAADYDTICQTMLPDHADVPTLDPDAAERIRQSIEDAPKSRFRIGPWVWRIAAAACLLITLTVVFSQMLKAPDHHASVAGSRGPSDAEVSQGIQVFKNVAALFDNRTSWVALSEKSSDIGLADTPVPESSKPVVVYLNLQRQQTAISELTLAIVPGQTARMEIPTASGQLIRYTLHVASTNPHQLTIGVDVSNEAMLRTTVKLNFGRQVQAARIQTTQDSYDLVVGLYSGKEPETAGGKSHL